MIINKLRTLPQYLVPQQFLSYCVGLLASQNKLSQLAINWFIKHYQVNMDEALESNPRSYSSFNDFFIRKLKPNARSIVAGDKVLISPVDGAISQLGQIQDGQLIQAKGQDYSALSLLGGNNSDVLPFLSGEFATLYLSPKDYHRVHMPCNGVLKKMIYIPGRLFAVKPMTAAAVPNLFARNERLAMFFDTEQGPLALVMVGAMIVGSMSTVWHGQVKRGNKIETWHYPNADFSEELAFKKGDELGYFCLGSTVIILASETMRLSWGESYQASSPIKMGEMLGAFAL